MTKPKFQIRKLLASQWVITLTSTMLGVVIGLYLSETNARSNTQEAQEVALTMVNQEISGNQKLLQEYHNVLGEKYEALSTFLPALNGDMVLVHKDSVDRFTQKVRSLMKLEKVEPYSDEMVRLRGELNFNLHTPMLLQEMSNVNWNVYSNTDYMTITPFNCVTTIARLYNVQDNVNAENKAWRELFFRYNFVQDPAVQSEFMIYYRNLLMKQAALLELFEVTTSELNDCIKN